MDCSWPVRRARCPTHSRSSSKVHEPIPGSPRGTRGVASTPESRLNLVRSPGHDEHRRINLDHNPHHDNTRD